MSEALDAFTGLLGRFTTAVESGDDGAFAALFWHTRGSDATLTPPELRQSDAPGSPSRNFRAWRRKSRGSWRTTLAVRWKP